MDLTLYRAVGTLNRVALGDLSKSEFYTASADDKGVITLTPVNIVEGSKRGTTTAAESTLDPDPNQPASEPAPFDN